MRPRALFAIAACLPAAVAFAEPAWDFDADGEGRLSLVAAVSEDDDVLEMPEDCSGEPVRSIGPRAWAGCPALRSVFVPASVEWIDPDAFRDCPSLERIVVDEANPVYSDVDGVLFDADGGYLLSCPEGRAGDYIVPAGTEEIDEGAFAGCFLLESVALPSGVTRIGADAFGGCDSLSKLSVPEGAAYDAAGLGTPEACRIVRYRPGALDDPTLPPRWALRFAANGGTGTMAEQVFERGTAAALRANGFSRKGYHFAGWARSAGGAVAFKNKQSVRDLAAAGARTTLYAKWDLNRYTVRFNANGGTGTMADEAFVWGTAKGLRRNAFTRKGYEFLGWSKTKGGAVAYKDAQSVKNLTSANGGVVTLYAVWRGVVYTVEFFREQQGKRRASQSLRYDSPKALRANDFGIRGRVFAGWAKTPDGAIVYQDRQVVKNLTATAGGCVRLYARWARPTFRVRFDPNGGSGRMDLQTFSYGQASKLRANAFVRKGFTFQGWSKTKGGAVAYTDAQSVKNLTLYGETVMLYAVWKRNRYNIRFVANGGTGTMANLTVGWGLEKALPACRFTRADCTFIGWAKSATSAVAFADGAAVSNLSAVEGKTINLYARWAKTNYAVRFDPNGGTGEMANEAFVWGASKRLRSNAFVREGWRFIGWARTADATRPKYRDSASVLNLTASGATVVLYAVWIREPDPNVVLCLGDSITQGYRCIGSPYPARLAQLTGRRVRNYGKGGEMSGYGASIAEEAIWTERPAFVCIQFGANDAIHHRSASETKANLRKIVRICRENGAVPLLATPTPQTGSHAKFNAGVKNIVSEVRALAREEGVRCVDLNAAFGSGRGYLNPADGLHLSNAGGDLMARLFRDALR